jgi:flavin-dependent dehydrogenase
MCVSLAAAPVAAYVLAQAGLKVALVEADNKRRCA